MGFARLAQPEELGLGFGSDLNALAVPANDSLGRNEKNSKHRADKFRLQGSRILDAIASLTELILAT